MLYENRFSGTIDLGNLPESMERFDVTKNALSGTVRVPKQVYRKGDRSFRFGGNMNLIVERV